MRIGLTRAIPAGAIIIAAGLGGFFAYGLFARSGPPMPVASAPLSQPLTTTAPGHASEGDASRARVIPDSFPDVAFADQAGLERRLSDWKGRPLLVNFWATWCEPCREETPLLERLSRERARNGLEVVGIAVDSRAAVLAYARHEGIKYPLLIGEQSGRELIQALGMEEVFPFSVFVDARGRIVTVKIGELHADQARLILGRVDDLDEGRIDLATARREIADGIARLGVSRAQVALSPKL